MRTSCLSVQPAVTGAPGSSTFGGTVAGVDSLVFVEPLDFAYLEQVFVRSDAALRVASYLGGPWKIALVAYVIPRPIRDYLYDQFARRRYRWFGKQDNCLLPPPEVRSRFLD